MAAGHGFVTQLFNPGAQLLLMGWVAHRKTGRDGKCADARRVVQDGCFGRRLIQRNSRVPPRIMAAIAGTYALKSDPSWVDYTACIQDLEATTYLRSLESMDPDFANATFSREVAASPNPRFIKPTLGAEESEEEEEEDWSEPVG